MQAFIHARATILRDAARLPLDEHEEKEHTHSAWGSDCDCGCVRDRAGCSFGSCCDAGTCNHERMLT